MTVAGNAAPAVNASRFRAAHQADWERLENLVERIEKRSVRALDEEELLILPLLYRSTLSCLSLARATSLDRALIVYLEQLCTRAYFQIYGVPTSAVHQIREFLVDGWPRAVSALWRETIVAVLLTVAATLAAFLLVRSDPSWFYAIIPDGLAQGRDPAADPVVLRQTIYGDHDDMLATFAAYLFTHNAQIAIFAFALGFAFALPTILLILYNGLMLGAMLAVFASKGLGLGFSAWLFIHGTTEIFAIVIAGAAGMHIGVAMIFPGGLERGDAAVRAGHVGARAMGGALIMLILAGLLEGIGRQVVQADGARFAIGATMLAGWLFYFYLPRRRAA